MTTKPSEPKRLTPARLAIDEPVDNPRNPRRHGPDQLAQLTASLKRFGQPRPILVRAENRMIVAGHGLRTAMLNAGETQIDVLLWDVDQPTADAFMLADNRLAIGGRDDPDRIAELLAELMGDNAASLGFSDEEAEKLLGEADELAVREVETGQVADRFWISVRGPLQRQAAALKALKRAMKDLPEIDVELGTVAEG